MSAGFFRKHRRLIVVLAVALAAGAAARIWHKNIRHELFPRNFRVVVEGRIYRSGQLTERMLRGVCREYSIRSIIDLSVQDQARPETIMERRVSGEIGVTRHEFSLAGDGSGDPQHYVAVLGLMADAENHPILVHCAAGAQRTSAAVILYRHIVEGRSLREAYPESFEFGHKPDEWELLAYLAENLDRIRASMAAKGAQLSGAD